MYKGGHISDVLLTCNPRAVSTAVVDGKGNIVTYSVESSIHLKPKVNDTKFSVGPGMKPFPDDLTLRRHRALP